VSPENDCLYIACIASRSHINSRRGYRSEESMSSIIVSISIVWYRIVSSVSM